MSEGSSFNFFGLIVLSLRRRSRYRSHSPPTLKFGNPKNLEKKWNLFFLPKAQKNWVREKMRRDDFSNFPIFSVDRTNIGSPVWHWSHENLNFAADARKTFKHSKRFFSEFLRSVKPIHFHRSRSISAFLNFSSSRCFFRFCQLSFVSHVTVLFSCSGILPSNVAIYSAATTS